MKHRITLDFLRGVLFSYAAWHICALANAFCFGVFFTGALGMVGMVSVGTLLAIYSGIAFALVFTPRGYSRFVMVFLGVVPAVQVLTIMACAALYPPGAPSPINKYFAGQFAIGAAAFGLAYGFHRAEERKEARKVPATQAEGRPG